MCGSFLIPFQSWPPGCRWSFRFVRNFQAIVNSMFQFRVFSIFRVGDLFLNLWKILPAICHLKELLMHNIYFIFDTNIYYVPRCASLCPRLWRGKEVRTYSAFSPEAHILVKARNKHIIIQEFRKWNMRVLNGAHTLVWWVEGWGYQEKFLGGDDT